MSSTSAGAIPDSPALDIGDRGPASAAALAALGEGAVFFLLVREALTDSILAATGGPLSSYILFCVVVSAGAALATRFRGSHWMAPGVVGGAVVLGGLHAAATGASWPAGPLTEVAVALGVGLRVVSLATRDWTEPITATFGWGTGALLVAVAMGREWQPLVVLGTAQFFAASLASRALSVRLASRGSGETVGSGRASTVAGSLAIGAALVVGAAAFLAVNHGPLDFVGRYVALALFGVIYAGGVVLITLLRWLPGLGGLVDLLRRSIDGLGRIISRLHHAAQGRQGGRARLPAPSPWLRLIGLAVLLMIITLLVRYIMRRRREWRSATGTIAADPESRPVAAAGTERRRGMPWRRKPRELPEDAVRRWYAEVLLEMERAGQPREPWETPAEVLQRTAGVFPQSRASLGVLTAAYEDVRYGRRKLEQPTFEAARHAHEEVVRGLRQGPGRD